MEWRRVGGGAHVDAVVVAAETVEEEVAVDLGA